MEYLFNEIRHTLLVRNDEMDGVIRPIRLEVTFFNDGSIFTKEIIETLSKSIVMNSSHYSSLEVFNCLCPEVAALIEKNKKV